MSMQQINLYQDSLKKQKLKYSAALLGKLIVLTVVICIVISGLSAWQLNLKQQELLTAKNNNQKVLSQLQVLQQQLASHQKDIGLEKEIENKTAELAKKQKVMQILSGDEFGNTHGFAEHITGLARQRIEGLWLTELHLKEGGTDLSLNGTTSRPELLPKYLQRLSAEKIFVGTEFKTMVMARREKQPNWLDFSLRNKGKEGTP